MARISPRQLESALPRFGNPPRESTSGAFGIRCRHCANRGHVWTAPTRRTRAELVVHASREVGSDPAADQHCSRSFPRSRLGRCSCFEKGVGEAVVIEIAFELARQLTDTALGGHCTTTDGLYAYASDEDDMRVPGPRSDAEGKQASEFDDSHSHDPSEAELWPERDSGDWKLNA